MSNILVLRNRHQLIHPFMCEDDDVSCMIKQKPNQPLSPRTAFLPIEVPKSSTVEVDNYWATCCKGYQDEYGFSPETGSARNMDIKYCDLSRRNHEDK